MKNSSSRDGRDGADGLTSKAAPRSEPEQTRPITCAHKRIAIYNHTGWPMGDDEYDGSDTQWELYCEDCELTIAEGDGWDDPKVAYKNWLSQQNATKPKAKKGGH